jgi:hypothetical protein
MALFGRRTAANMRPTIPLMDELQSAAPKQGGTERVTSGGPFRTMFGRKNLPRTLQILGAGLQDINGQGHLAAFQDNEAEQQRLQAAEMAQSRQTKLQDEQRNQFEQVIASLPPEQQRLARLDPEGFVRGLLRQQGESEWQTNGTQPYRIGPDGRVVMGSGTIPHRPRAPLIQYGTPGDAEDWEYGD